MFTDTYTESDSDTDTEIETYTDTNTDTTTDLESDEQFREIKRFIIKRNKQDTLTLNEIKDQLIGYIKLKTIEEKSLINKLPIFRTHIRYINLKLKKYRMGGLLLKSDYPDSITLINTVNNFVWTINLDDVVLYVKENIVTEEIKKNKLYKLYQKGELEPVINKSNVKIIYKKYKFSKTKEQIIKDKLYQMYKNKTIKQV